MLTQLDVRDYTLYGNEAFLKGMSSEFPHASSREVAISFLLMVKDESRVINRCLTALLKEKRACDEIIVLDTGSSDDTLALLCEHDDIRIHSMAWENSFSVARNKLIELATKSVVFFIDADEVLQAGTVQILVDIVEECLQSFPDGFLLNPVIANDDGSVVRGVSRIFPRTSGFYFSGRVHEKVMSSREGWTPPVGVLPGITLRHDGYRPESVRAKQKAKRNTDLLHLMVAEGDTDLWTRYFLCRDGNGYIAETERRAALISLFEEVQGSALTLDIDLRISVAQLMIDQALEDADDTRLQAAVESLAEMMGEDFADVMYIRKYQKYLIRQQEAQADLQELVRYRTTRKLPAYGSQNANYRQIEYIIALLKEETGDIENAKVILQKLEEIGFLTRR